MRILFKFATRARSHKFFNCLDNIMLLVSDKLNYDILISCDDDDESMFGEKIKEKMLEHAARGSIIMKMGKSKGKIDAINRDIDGMSSWDILINTSDDMMFLQKGFDDT